MKERTGGQECRLDALLAVRTYWTIKRPRILKMESYLTVSHGGWNDLRLIGRQAMTRLRCGANELRIDTGRHDGVAAQDRLCRICSDGSVEDERHFLLACEHYQADPKRLQLWEDLDRLVRGFGSIDGSAPSAPLFSVSALSDHERF